MQEFTPGLLLALGIAAVAGYLLGSVNFAIILCRLFYGTDIRTLGSGNAGMTNVLRNFGKKGAILTLAGDAGKGAAAVMLGRLLVLLLAPQGTLLLYGAYVGGVCAVIGHTFPVFFNFKGGKGVAVSAGTILAIEPLILLVLLSLFLLIVLITGMVSLGSVLGISLYPVLTLLYSLFVTHKIPAFSTICAFIIAALVIWLHRANIKRILSGTEYRFGKRGAAQRAAEAAKAEEEKAGAPPPSA